MGTPGHFSGCHIARGARGSCTPKQKTSQASRQWRSRMLLSDNFDDARLQTSCRDATETCRPSIMATLTSLVASPTRYSSPNCWHPCIYYCLARADQTQIRVGCAAPRRVATQRLTEVMTKSPGLGKWGALHVCPSSRSSNHLYPSCISCIMHLHLWDGRNGRSPGRGSGRGPSLGTHVSNFHLQGSRAETAPGHRHRDQVTSRSHQRRTEEANKRRCWQAARHCQHLTQRGTERGRGRESKAVCSKMPQHAAVKRTPVSE